MPKPTYHHTSKFLCLLMPLCLLHTSAATPSDKKATTKKVEIQGTPKTKCQRPSSKARPLSDSLQQKRILYYTFWLAVSFTNALFYYKQFFSSLCIATSWYGSIVMLLNTTSAIYLSHYFVDPSEEERARYVSLKENIVFTLTFIAVALCVVMFIRSPYIPKSWIAKDAEQALSPKKNIQRWILEYLFAIIYVWAFEIVQYLFDTSASEEEQPSTTKPIEPAKNVIPSTDRGTS